MRENLQKAEEEIKEETIKTEIKQFSEIHGLSRLKMCFFFEVRPLGKRGLRVVSSDGIGGAAAPEKLGGKTMRNIVIAHVLLLSAATVTKLPRKTEKKTKHNKTETA